MNAFRKSDPPPIKGEMRHSEPASGWRLAPAALCVTAALVSVLNVVAAVYLYKSSSTVAALESKLEALGDFEYRVRSRLELMDQGMQSRFDRQNGAMGGNFAEIRRRIKAVEQMLNGIDAEAVGVRSGERTLPVQQFPPQMTEDEDSSDEDTGAPKVAKEDSSATQSGQPGLVYQRIESADGKVYYRRRK